MFVCYKVVEKVMDLPTTGSLGTSGVKLVTRKYLFSRLMKEKLPHLEDKLNSLKKQLLSCEGYTEDQIKTLKQNFSHYKSEIKRRWAKAHNKEDIFVQYNSSWLNGTFEIPVATSPQNRTGRPTKPFEQLSERSKRRKTEKLRSTFEEEVIVHAAQTELRKTGKRDASDVLKEIITTPTRATKYKKAYYHTKTTKNKTSRLSTMRALQMFIDADLTRDTYEVVRSTNKRFFPCYSLLQKEKNKCYPPPEACKITNNSAEAKLQPLVDLTVTRLSVYLEEVLITLNDKERETLTMYYKWGCDGSQQSQFKQKVDCDADTDSSIFQSCFVPLKLVSHEKIVWENPTPSSPRFCRLIRFRYIKETTEVTQQEISYVNHSIESLIATDVYLDRKKFIIKHKFIMTMVDGKVCNAATGTTSTSRCYICGETSKDFNRLDKSKETDYKAIQFGLSVLHARIRLFESVLHLAYKLPVQKYRERKTEAEKDLEKNRKKEIQEEFRKQTGLLVDMPKANFGNTNDGNTSRRFFENPKLAAEITGISYDLIYRLKVILEVISSGHKIDYNKYEKYAAETAKLYVELYSWHPMTPTMHKILIHGAEIIKNSLLPIGQLSEEAAEARNKHFRSYRLDFARKFSRESCNRDVFNRLLLSSDPLLSSMRRIQRRKSHSFLPQSLEMFLPSEPNTKAESDSENSSESENESKIAGDDISDFE